MATTTKKTKKTGQEKVANAFGFTIEGSEDSKKTVTREEAKKIKADLEKKNGANILEKKLAENIEKAEQSEADSKKVDKLEKSKQPEKALVNGDVSKLLRERIEALEVVEKTEKKIKDLLKVDLSQSDLLVYGLIWEQTKDDKNHEGFTGSLDRFSELIGLNKGVIRVSLKDLREAGLIERSGTIARCIYHVAEPKAKK